MLNWLIKANSLRIVKFFFGHWYFFLLYGAKMMYAVSPRVGFLSTLAVGLFAIKYIMNIRKSEQYLFYKNIALVIFNKSKTVYQKIKKNPENYS